MCSKSIPYLPALCTSWLALRWPGRVVGDHSANAVCSILGVLWWIGFSSFWLIGKGMIPSSNKCYRVWKFWVLAVETRWESLHNQLKDEWTFRDESAILDYLNYKESKSTRNLGYSPLYVVSFRFLPPNHLYLPLLVPMLQAFWMIVWKRW